VSTQGVDALRALMHQKVPGSEHDAIGLLLLILDRNKPHARPLCRLTDGLGIRRVVLLSFHERLNVGGWDQTHRVPQLADLTRPVVRTGAGFHRDDTGGLRREEPK
jgi:hypothetical protein